MGKTWRGYGKKTLGIALIGSGFMGTVHARAYRAIPYLYPHAVHPDLQVVVDVTEAAARKAATAWGIPRWTADWQSVLADDMIDVVDICTPPELHALIGSAAAAAGKHVYCEKPLGRSTAETRALCAAVEQHGVASFTGFNYRWCPAVIEAQQIIAAGRLGRLQHFRACFNSDWAADPALPWSWRFSRGTAGYGALADVGSHVFDMARFLVGEMTVIAGFTSQFITDRPVAGDPAARQPVDNDDHFAALVRFAGDATGVLEGSRVATGSKTRFAFEVSGDRGALCWDFERMNELEVYLTQADKRTEGYTRVLIGPRHPFQGDFVPQAGIGIGYLETKVLEANAFLTAVAQGIEARPYLSRCRAVAELLDRVAQGG